MNYQGTDIHLGIGNGFYRNVEVAHYHRPSEKLAFTVSGFYSGLKGFIDNQNFDEKNDRSLEAGGKVRLIFAPSQQLKFDWTADYQWVSQNAYRSQYPRRRAFEAVRVPGASTDGWASS